MPHITVTTRSGDVRKIDAESNRTLLETIQDGGIHELSAICGGCCSCATCHVYVSHEDSDRLPPLTDDEDALLSGSGYRKKESRLACQLHLVESLDGLSVTVAPED